MKPRNWSVSQVLLFLDCKRKHFLKSILRIPEPTNESAARGVSIHKGAENVGERLERRLLLADALDQHDGTDAPWMPYVRALAKASVFPEPGESHAREHRFSLPTHTGIPLIGVIDLILEDRDPIHLKDYKSLSDIRYAKTPGELITDLQLNTYGRYIFENSDVDFVRATLAYVEAKKKPLKTKPPRTLIVTVDLERESVRRIWEGELPFVKDGKEFYLPQVLDQMLEIATTVTDFNDVAPTTTNCPKYGGCAYQAKCGFSSFTNINTANDHAPKKRITIGESYMGFMDRKKTNGSTAPAQGASAPPPVAAPAPEPEGKGGFLARVRAKAAAQDGEAARQARLDQDFGPKEPQVPTGIVPPDAPPRATPLERAAAPVLTVGAGEDAPETPEGASEPPKKRGRPRKAAPEGSGNQGVETGRTAVGAAPDADPAPRALAKTGRREFILYIDVMMTKGAGGVEPTTLEDFFGPIDMELNEWALEEKKLPSWWLTGFGEQKAALGIAIRDRIEKGLPPAMLVRSSSGIARDILPMLVPHATQIFNALRG